MATDVGSAVGYLDLDIKGFLSGLKTAQSEAETASKTMATKFGDGMTSMGNSMSSVGSSLTKSISVPLLAIGGVGLKVATDFATNMSKVKAIAGASEADFNKLRDAAIDLGASSAFSATEVADAMSEMAKAGWQSQQILDGMSGVLDAAAASGESLATVSTIVADTITGFGLAAADSTRVADLLTQAANSGTIGISDLGETYKYIAPVAKTMGLKIEDVTVAIAAMSKAGIKGSAAGTSLRGWLTNLIKPSDAVAAAMKELGISITNSDGSFKPLSQDVDELRTIFSKLTDEQKTYYAATIAGKEGMSGMLSMLGLTKEEYDGIAKSMYGAEGVAKSTAATMQDNLGNKVEQLKGSLESLAIKMADYVMPALQAFTLKVTDLVNKFTNLDPEMQKNILKWAGIAIAIGPALFAMGKIVSMTGTVISVLGKAPAAIALASGGFKAFSGGMSAFAAGTTVAEAGLTGMAATVGAVALPIIAVVATIALLIAAFVNLWKTNEGFRNGMISTWATIVETISGFIEGITARFGALGINFDSILAGIKLAWNNFCALLAPIFTGAFQLLSNTLTTVFGIITGILDVFIGLFTGNWSQMWLGIKEIFGSLWNGIIGTFSIVGEMLINVLIILIQNIMGYISSIGTMIMASFTAFGENLMLFINSIPAFFETLPQMIGFALGFVLGVIINWGANMQTLAIKTGTEFVANVKLFFTNLPTMIGTFLTNAITKVSEWKDNLGKKGTESMENFFTSLKTAADNLPAKLMEIGKNIVEGVWNGIVGAKDWFNDQISSFFTGMVDGVKEGLGVHSPSTVFAAIGKWLPPGLVNGFASAMPAAISSIQTVISKGVNSLDAGKVNLGIAVDKLSLVDKVKTTFNGVMTVMSSVEQRFTNSVDVMADSLSSLLYMGKQVVTDGGGLGYVNLGGYTAKTPVTIASKTAEIENSAVGDTFVFNSPKPIDELQAAKLLKETKRELSEGL